MLAVVISAIAPALIPVNAVCMGLLFKTVAVVNRSNRAVKRLANNAVSPVTTTIAEAERGREVRGATGIRFVGGGVPP